MNTLRTILPYIAPAFFAAWLEAMLFFGAVPAVVAGAVVLTLLPAFFPPKRSWQDRLMIAAWSGISFLTVARLGIAAGQVMVAISLAGVLILSGRLSRQGPKMTLEFLLEFRRAVHHLFLFFVFLNFFIVQSRALVPYGAAYLGAVTLVFLGARSVVAEGVAAGIATLLIAELIFLFRFLPHGYVALAVVSLVASHALFQTLSFRGAAYWRLAGKLALYAGLAAAILASSGIRPR